MIHMALTLEAEQRLDAAGLVGLYQQHDAVWLAAAKQTRAFVGGNFPNGSLVRRDDVAKALHPIMEVNETLRDYLDTEKLRGKFWVKDFVDLIIDRTWGQLEE